MGDFKTIAKVATDLVIERWQSSDLANQIWSKRGLEVQHGKLASNGVGKREVISYNQGVGSSSGYGYRYRYVHAALGLDV